ncbi:MAG: virulence factor [Gammaproteobacteria bacterium RIFCSPHIGHO2_12_FULL_41_20]|nr:MAG: virulence factor [Gammaproteobacteria bacterium RIFCSPHIGHO2_12_FULL_41_20]
MKIAKVFQCGNSQALRLPKEFRFSSQEVEIFQRGEEIILRAKPKNLRHAFELLADMPDDFFSHPREDMPPQDRESFK